jgi:hypothetical protein
VKRHPDDDALFTETYPSILSVFSVLNTLSLSALQTLNIQQIETKRGNVRTNVTQSRIYVTNVTVEKAVRITHSECILTFICLRATLLSYDVAHRAVRS